MNIKPVYLVLALAAVFFLLYAYLPLNSPAKFTSPDETVNYAFIQVFAEENRLYIEEPLNAVAEKAVHPRNAVANEARIVPKGFLGIFLIYGTAERFFPGVAEFLTPLAAAVGLFLFYLLVREHFSQRTALISTLLLAVLPAYWFWASMGMFNNLLATVFFIAGARHYLRLWGEGKTRDYALAGVLWGLAAIVRYEFLLLAGALLVVAWFVQWKEQRFHLPSAALTLVLLGLVFSVILVQNAELYGNPFSLGYREAPEIGGGEETLIDKAVRVADRVRFYLLPSGFRPWRLLKNTADYITGILPAFFALGIAGIALYLTRQKPIWANMPGKGYIVLAGMTTVFFLMYYGNGIFHGHGYTHPILMSSYTRYFLPFYVLALPFAALFLQKLAARRVMAGIVVVAVLVASVHAVYLSNNALDSIQKKRVFYDSIEAHFDGLTEPDSVIIARYWDKAIYPSRRVVTFSEGLRPSDVEAHVSAIAGMVDQGVVVYFLNDTRNINLDRVRSELENQGISSARVDRDYGGLYRFWRDSNP